MDPLRLSAPRSIWERYHQDRRALQRVGSELKPLVAAWDRARAAGAPTEGPPPEEHLLGAEALTAHREPLEPLLVDGGQALDRATAAFAGRDHLLLLADPTGVVAHVAGGGAFAADGRRLRLIPGASWSEGVRGTNAIGTALAEDRATVVEGAAHYGRRFHGLVCYAAPIHGPDGRLIGVLDATSFAARADDTVGVLVSAAALALEAVVRARAWAGVGRSALALVERTLDRVRDPAMLVEPPGRIVRCNAAARVWLGPAPLPRDVGPALGVPFEALWSEATHPTPGGLRLGSGARALRARVEPLLAGDGAVLALAVYAEPTPTVRGLPESAPQPVAAEDPFARIFAEDPATRAAVDFARRVARSELPVVLLSETGSGKELFAEAMHGASPRSAGPFVPVNCGSLTPQLLESELFGYAPGAFTGAGREGREGLFHAARGGTLFLDEVAEMPAAMQTALLRVLESGQYHRVGETTPRKADVRVLCATCRDLVGLVEQGVFRKDLFFRLKSVVVSLPPLRRRTDRVVLARHLAGADRPFTPELVSWIERYDWPGNVRELKAVVAVLRLLGEDAEALDLAHLPPDLAPGLPAAAPPAPEASASLAEVETHAVQRALAELGGNVSAAARRLGVARSTIYRMLRRSEA